MTYSRGGGCNPIGCVIALLILFLAFAFLSLVTLVMVGIGIMLYHIARWLFAPQPRIFGAWPMSRWTMAFEQGMFQLEELTHIDFNSTPVRMLSANLIIAVTPLLFLGFGLAFFHPDWLKILPIIGLIIGFVTTMVLSRSPTEWFSPLAGYDQVGDALSFEDHLLLEDGDEW